MTVILLSDKLEKYDLIVNPSIISLHYSNG